MLKALIIWGTILSSGLAFAFHAAANGTGIQQPGVNPPSIREGSVTNSSGTRTRYFIGGGIHGGK
jgi:hypothetical protein